MRNAQVCCSQTRSRGVLTFTTVTCVRKESGAAEYTILQIGIPGWGRWFRLPRPAARNVGAGRRHRLPHQVFGIRHRNSLRRHRAGGAGALASIELLRPFDQALEQLPDLFSGVLILEVALF